MALFLAHPVRCKFFHSSGFLDRFFRVDREFDRGVDPRPDLRIMRSIGGARRAFDDVAFARAECGLAFRRLSGPKVLLLQEVLVAESRAERMNVPLFKGQYMSHGFARVNNLDRVFAIRAHLYKYMIAQIAMRRGIVYREGLSEIDKRAQHPRKPMCLDGHGIGNARPSRVDRDEVACDYEKSAVSICFRSMAKRSLTFAVCAQSAGTSAAIKNENRATNRAVCRPFKFRAILMPPTIFILGSTFMLQFCHRGCEYGAAHSGRCHSRGSQSPASCRGSHGCRAEYP